MFSPDTRQPITENSHVSDASKQLCPDKLQVVADVYQPLKHHVFSFHFLAINFYVWNVIYIVQTANVTYRCTNQAFFANCATANRLCNETLPLVAKIQVHFLWLNQRVSHVRAFSTHSSAPVHQRSSQDTIRQSNGSDSYCQVQKPRPGRPSPIPHHPLSQ
jgi:hypothetical protein